MVKFLERFRESRLGRKFIRIGENWKRRGERGSRETARHERTGMPCKLPSSLFISISGSCQPTLRTRSREIPKETTRAHTTASDIGTVTSPLFRYVIGLVNVDRTLTLVVRSEI